MVAAYTSIFYYYVKENHEIFIELIDMSDEARAQMNKELFQITLGMGISGVLFLLLTGIIGIFLSHRIAGPLYKIQKTFEKIKDGDLTQRVFLRPKDELRDFAEDFNQMMDSIENKK